MPEISRFMGMIITMYCFDDERHHKPHVHVRYGEYKCSVSIDGSLLAGKIPEKQLKILTAWLLIHEADLYKEWNKAAKGENPAKISPLR